MYNFFLGELLMRLECEDFERFEQAAQFHVRYTGAEANAAVAMCSLGAREVYLVSAVPENAIGRSCLNELHKYGPDVSLVRRAKGRLGLFFLETGMALRPSQVIYDRRGSVFAELPAEAYDLPGLFRSHPAPGWLHLSGTLPALSNNGRELAFLAVREAKRAGYTVSLDLNYRSSLWSEAEAGETFRLLVAESDVLIANAAVATDFLETPEEELCVRFSLRCAFLSRRGETDASQTKFGGSLLRPDGGRVDTPMHTFPVLDRVGGGDAFAGAAIYALQQEEWQDLYRIRFATACGALKHATRGDFSLSTRSEVESLLSADTLAIRR